MAGRGPAPTPTAVLKTRGSRRARARKAEPAGAVGPLRPPSGLSVAELAVFRSLVKAAPWATASDVRVLAAIARLEVVIAEARRRRRELGDYLVIRDAQGVMTSTRKAPWLAVELEATGQLKQLLAEVGLTPASRTRVKTGEAPDQSDPFAEFEVGGSSLHLVKRSESA